MKCETCGDAGVKPPDILCGPCTTNVGGNGFLICVKCRATWGIIGREDGTELFPIIPGKTYRTTACTTCGGSSVNFKIIEESEARERVNFAIELKPELLFKRIDSVVNYVLNQSLETKLHNILDRGIRSRSAFDVAARVHVALSLKRPVLKNGPWLLSLMPGTAGREPSIDAINLEVL